MIAREERYLEYKFGDAYRAYKRRGASVGLITLLARGWQKHHGPTRNAADLQRRTTRWTFAGKKALLAYCRVNRRPAPVLDFRHVLAVLPNVSFVF